MSVFLSAGETCSWGDVSPEALPVEEEVPEEAAGN